MSYEAAEYQQCSKKGMFSDTVLTLILFNATITAATAIADKGYKQRAKNWLKLFFLSGTSLWKEVKKTTSDIPETMDVYEELSGYVYEVVKIALQKDDYNKFLKQIQE